MIWKTAKLTEVKQAPQARSRDGPAMFRPDGRVVAAETAAGLAMARAPRRRRGPGRAARRVRRGWRPVLAPGRRPRGGLEGGGEVGLQVLEILEPDRDAQEARRDPGRRQVGLARLAVRGRRRVDDHRVDAPERGGQLGERQRVDAGARPATRPPSTSKASIPPRRPPELAKRDLVLGMAGEARVEDAPDAGLPLEPGRQGGGGRGVALGADGEGQDPAQDEEGIERAERGAGIDLDALDLGDEVAPAGDDPGDDVAVAAEELGRRLGDEVGAELQRPADVGRRERVVDDVAARRARWASSASAA